VTSFSVQELTARDSVTNITMAMDDIFFMVSRINSFGQCSNNVLASYFKYLLLLIRYRCNYFLTFLLLLSSISAKSQNDGKLKDLLKISPEKFRDSIYYELFRDNRISNPIQAKYYAVSSLNYAKIYGNLGAEVKAFRALGFLQEVKGNVDSATLFYHTALRLAIANNFPDRAINLYNDLGVLYHKSDVYDSALHYFMLCHDLSIKRNLGELTAISCRNIGAVFYYLENYEEALKYYYESVKLDSVNKQDENLSYNLLEIASILNEQGDYKGATANLLKVQKICSKECSENVHARLLFRWAYLNYSRGSTTLAKTQFEQTLQYAKTKNNNKIAADALFYLSLLSSKTGNNNVAIDLLILSGGYAQKINHRRLLREIYLELAQLYLKTGNLDSSNHYQQQYIRLKGEIFNNKVANTISSIRLTAQQNESNEIIEQKNIQLWHANKFSIILIVNVVLAFMLVYLVYRGLRASWKNKKDMAYNMSVMLNERENNQREVFRLQLERDELTNRVRSFLNGPVATLAGLADVFKNASTQDEFQLCNEKMRWVCKTISIVLNNMQDLILCSESVVSIEQVDLRSVCLAVNEDFKKMKSFLLINMELPNGEDCVVNSDKKLLTDLITHSIKYFQYANENPVVELSFRFRHETSLIVITIKHHSDLSTSNEHASQLNYLTAQVIAGKLGGSVVIIKREDHTTFEITLPTNLTLAGDKSESMSMASG